MINAIDISTSGLLAQRLRLDAIASNIANVNTTRDANNQPNPYVRKQVIFQAGADSQEPMGVHVAAIQQDNPDDPNNIGVEPFKQKYEPGHPDANSQGFVRLPNVDLTKEFVNALEASRAYEANIQAIEIAKAMNNRASRLIE